MPADIIPVQGLKLGYVGEISHEGYPIKEAKSVQSTDTLSVPFGSPVVVNANNSYSSVASFITNGGTFTATTPIGIALRNIRTPFGGTFNLGIGTNQAVTAYAPGNAMDALVIGTTNVACNNGTPTANGPVYVRIAPNAAIPASVVGGFEAAADGVNSVLRADLKWRTGFLETDTTAELTILSRSIA